MSGRSNSTARGSAGSRASPRDQGGRGRDGRGRGGRALPRDGSGRGRVFPPGGGTLLSSNGGHEREGGGRGGSLGALNNRSGRGSLGGRAFLPKDGRGGGFESGQSSLASVALGSSLPSQSAVLKGSEENAQGMDPHQMSYREKQKECKRRGLPATGKDKDLLQRLLGSSGSEQAADKGKVHDSVNQTTCF